MKKLLILAALAFFATTAFSQTNLFSAGVCHTAAAPAFNPGLKGCRLALDTTSQAFYVWKIGTVWVALGRGVDEILGCSAPAYTPTKWQSSVVINKCTPNPELYYYFAGTWKLEGGAGGGVYTAGAGINISAGNVISNAGDLSNTNEIQNLSLAGQALSISSGTGVTLPVVGGAAADFDLSSGVLSLDYTNAQKATAVVPGFLTAADFAAFNAKDPSATNEIQALSIVGQDLTLSLGGGTVVIPGGGGGSLGTGFTSGGGSGTIPDGTQAAANGEFYLQSNFNFGGYARLQSGVDFTSYGFDRAMGFIGDNGSGNTVKMAVGDDFGDPLFLIESLNTGAGSKVNSIRIPTSSNVDISSQYGVRFNTVGATSDIIVNSGNATGIKYFADYSATIIANLGSIPDVRTVKQIYTAGTGISVTPSGNFQVIANTSPFSDENAQDAVGAMAGQTLTYTDATPLLDVKTQMSITSDASGVKLSGDAASPGNTQLYGTNGSGVKGWYAQPAGGGGGFSLDNYRLPATYQKLPAFGLNANESVVNYNFTSVNANKYKFSTTAYGASSTDFGGWLGNGTSGDSIAVSTPFWVVIGDSQAKGSNSSFGRLQNNVGSVDLTYADVPGQLSYTLARLTNMRFYNHGINTHTTALVWARWRRDVLGETYDAGDGRPTRTLQRKPMGVVVVVGINDFFGGATHTGAAIDNLESMANSARQNGIQCVFLNCPGQEAATLTQIKQIDSLNTYFASGALQAMGAAVVDYNKWWRDATYSDNVHGNAYVTDDIHLSPTGYDSLSVYVFNQAKLPVLDSVTIYTDLSPAGFAGFARPNSITIQGRPYTITGDAVTLPIVSHRFLHDSVWIKIVSSTNITGTTYSGFSHLIWHVKNDTAGVVTRRFQTYENYDGLSSVSGIANQFAYFTSARNVTSSYTFRFKPNNNLFFYTQLGADALTTGQSNTAIGGGAGVKITTGSHNVLLGSSAGTNITTASNNFFFGTGAGDVTSTGSNNIAIGADAMGANTTGFVNNAFGFNSLVMNTTGAGNVANGFEALRANTTANFNVAVGYQSGHTNTTGVDNIYIGTQAGNTSTTGNNNILLGRTALASAAGSSSQLNIGNILFGTGIDNIRATGLSGGRIGVGTDVPTAALHIKAGTATANTAPVKLNSGPLLTVTEGGAVGYNNSLYFTKNSGLRFGIGGIIFKSSTTVPNVTTTETDLYSHTLPVNTLATENESIEAAFSVSTLGSATATTQNRLYFGGTLVYDSGALGLSVASDFRYTVEVVRESSTVVKVSVTGATTSATAAPYVVYTRITGLTLSNTQILKITGTRGGVGAASADINGTMSTVKWFPAAG